MEICYSLKQWRGRLLVFFKLLRCAKYGTIAHQKYTADKHAKIKVRDDHVLVNNVKMMMSMPPCQMMWVVSFLC